jgi:uncharacterized protein
MHYLLFYEKVSDHVERQVSLAAAHLAYLEVAVKQRMLILGGSLADPVDGSAVLLLDANSVGAVETFAKEDPYVIGGIVCRWRVRTWQTVVGTGLQASL